jgi:hypothetical protein
MGYDCSSRFDEEVTFRANIWQWPAIIQLIRETEVLEDDLLTEMEHNNGSGPDADQCSEMAKALGMALLAKPQDYVFDYTDTITPRFDIEAVTKLIVSEGGFETDEVQIQLGQDGVYVTAPHLAEFVLFCIESSRCGGFEVW